MRNASSAGEGGGPRRRPRAGHPEPPADRDGDGDTDAGTAAAGAAPPEPHADGGPGGGGPGKSADTRVRSAPSPQPYADGGLGADSAVGDGGASVPPTEPYAGGGPGGGGGMRLRDAFRGRSRVVAVLLGWSVLEAGQTFLLGYALARAMDDGFLRGRQGTGLWWLALAAAGVPAGAYGTARVFGAVAALVEPLRDRLVRGVVRRGLRDAVRAGGGGRAADSAVVSRLTHQVEIARDAFGGIVMVLRSFAFTAAGALAGMIALAPVLLLVVLPPLVAGVGLFVAALRPLARRQDRYLTTDEAVAEECGALAAGLRDITACGAREPVAGRADERIGAALGAARSLARFGVVRTAALAVGGQLPLVLLLLAAPWLLSSHRITPGALLGAFAYLTQSLQPALQNLVHTLGAAGTRLGVILTRLTPPEPDALTGPDAPGSAPVEGNGPPPPASARRSGPVAEPDAPGSPAPTASAGSSGRRGLRSRRPALDVAREPGPVAGPDAPGSPAPTAFAGSSGRRGLRSRRPASDVAREPGPVAGPDAPGSPPPVGPVSAVFAGPRVRRGLRSGAVPPPGGRSASDGQRPGGGCGVPAGGVAVELCGVSFGYGPGAVPVLDGVDLAVREGEHLAVVGPSGAGKSTFAGVVAGVLRAGAGEVRVRGEVVLVPQEAYVFRGTVAENVGYLLPDGYGERAVAEAVAAVGAGELVAALGGPGGRVDPAALSAGERQLLALARTYAAPGRIVLLDEATCHLDADAEARAERAFAARPETTLLVVAHRISSARRAARTLVLDGAHTACAPHTELLALSPLYRDLAAAWTPAPAPQAPPLTPTPRSGRS